MPHLHQTCARRASTWLALLLAGCSLLPGQNPPAETPVYNAYVLMGEGGATLARAIVSGTTCPAIRVDGAEESMAVRVAAGTSALRPTSSAPRDSKPSAFPVLTCEFRIPAGAKRATIGGAELHLPKSAPQRIVVIGDTGCRMKRGDRAWQGCSDRNEWPFQDVANAAAAVKPDLVIHVGDFHYRENACPAEIPGCRDSPWGYGWDAWQADLFEPAAKLLAAAPWVVVRGNHEECRRAGQGWFRFLDVRPYDERRSCNDAKFDPEANFSSPYAVPIAEDLQLIVFDSALAGHYTLDPAKPRDAHTFAQYKQEFAQVDVLAGKPGVNSIFINHHPILAYAPVDELGFHGGGAAQLSVMKTLHPLAYYPSSVSLALHGHVHLFQAINFSSNHPATIVSGMGGNQLDQHLPDPFPYGVEPAEGAVVESITHGNEFGFAVMEKQAGGWQVRAYNRHGVLRTTCMLAGSKIHCDKTGLLK